MLGMLFMGRAGPRSMLGKEGLVCPGGSPFPLSAVLFGQVLFGQNLMGGMRVGQIEGLKNSHCDIVRDG